MQCRPQVVTAVSKRSACAQAHLHSLRSPWAATTRRPHLPLPASPGSRPLTAPRQRASAASTATSSSTLTSAPPTPAPSPSTPPPEQFVWTQNWYPVAVTDYLDPTRPHAFTLLGRNLVIWRDGSGVWRAFEDACPHRLVPLSEGRVEKDGTLLCAYHAWRFDGSGACTHIPQAASPEAQAKACGLKGSCATAYPTRELQGLLWVWAEPGLVGQLNSQQKQPLTIPELDEVEPSRLVSPPWSFRDLPYSHDYFIENVTDPSHAIVSHHNIAGNRYQQDQYFDLAVERPTTPNGGFKYSVKQRSPTNTFGPPADRGSTEFLPPCLVRIKAEFNSGSSVLLALYSCPVAPGRTRHIGRQILIRDKDGKLPKGLGFFARPMPTWLLHSLAALFLHQDQVFLHHQERIVAQKGARKYFMPTPADSMTIAFRNWMTQMAGGGIPYAGVAASVSTAAIAAANGAADTLPDDSTTPLVAVPSSSVPSAAALPPTSKDALFDTYEAHTSKCRVCSAALKNLIVARAAAAAAAAVGVLAAAVITAVTASAKAAALVAAGGGAAATTASAAATSALLSLPPVGAWVVLLLAALGGAAAAVCHKLIQFMHRYEFSHADNH